jgi:hypothetical protein
MAEFLFARAINKTEEFRLASNVDGAGAFDDLVFRYKLRDPGIWKTCFIQLKHKENGGTIQRSSLTQKSGDFSLLQYFKSFCEIKNKAATDPNLKQCGPFDDFEFVIYTNRKIGSKSPQQGNSDPFEFVIHINGNISVQALQGEDSGPLSILSSATDKGKYITFEFSDELSGYHKLIGDLDKLLKG